MRRTIIIAAGAFALAAAPTVAQAQNVPVKPAATGQAAANGEAPKMSPEELANFQRAIKIIRLFTEAFTSDKVSTAVKGRLISCLYSNDLSKISKATAQVLTNSPTLDGDKPADLYRASAGVCGIVFKKAADGDAAAGDNTEKTAR